MLPSPSSLPLPSPLFLSPPLPSPSLRSRALQNLAKGFGGALYTPPVGPGGARPPKHICYIVHLKTAFSEYNYCSFCGEEVKFHHRKSNFEVKLTCCRFKARNFSITLQRM